MLFELTGNRRLTLAPNQYFLRDSIQVLAAAIPNQITRIVLSSKSVPTQLKV